MWVFTPNKTSICSAVLAQPTHRTDWQKLGLSIAIVHISCIQCSIIIINRISQHMLRLHQYFTSIQEFTLLLGSSPCAQCTHWQQTVIRQADSTRVIISLLQCHSLLCRKEYCSHWPILCSRGDVVKRLPDITSRVARFTPAYSLGWASKPFWYLQYAIQTLQHNGKINHQLQAAWALIAQNSQSFMAQSC